MSDRTDGSIGFLFLVVVLLFVWWWFGLSIMLTVIGVSFVALVVIGLFASK